MPAANTRLLFIPVSGARGMGEYARSLAIATAMTRRFPQLEVHFALSRAAPYAAATPFASTLLPASPTFHTREVCALIREFRPQLVIFDNAGRTAQLRAARAAGARVVFISSRPRQRRKAFRLRWLALLDEHWIAYPEFIAGMLTALERLKLRLRPGARVRFVDVLLPEADAALAAATLARFGLSAREFVLIVPGGGSGHPGAEHAPAVMAAAAGALAGRGCDTLLVGTAAHDAAAAAGEPAHLRRAPLLPLAELAELMRAARLVVSNGGDTLLQVLACARPCVAVPIAGDQAHRIERCVRAGLAIRGELEPRALVDTVMALLGGALPAPAAAPAGPRVRNCMEEVLSALAALVAR
jgi:ADP-heptose:LPS heptosyltransferase